MATISRDQFDESNGVIKKVFQTGNFVADADLNEQSDILINIIRRTLSCLMKNQSWRFEDGFKVVGTGASLQVTITAGYMAGEIETDKNVILKLDGNYTLAGFTAWTAARTDYIYVDILTEEVTAADDADIVNPMIGEETCVDIRVSYTFAISEGAVPGTPPADHAYVTLASVTKSSGSNIEAGDVTVLIDDYYLNFEAADLSITTAKLAALAVTTAKLGPDAVDGTKIADNAVDTEHIAASAITNTKLDGDCVDGSNIVDDAVDAEHIADGAVGTNQIAASAVTGPKIAAAAVGTDKLDTASVTETKLASDAVTNVKLAADSVTASKIADNAVQKEHLNADVVGDGLTQNTDGSLKVTGVITKSPGLHVLKFDVVDIGDWNMDSTATLAATSAVKYHQVRSVDVIIRDDDGVSHRLEEGGDFTISVFDVDETQIDMTRTGAGIFDSTDFDATSYNRGWVTIGYVE